MKLADAQFTVFDVETTGLYPYAGDRICEIGAIRVGRRKAARQFHALVNPGRPISAGAFAVNGITEEMLEGKPAIDEILPDFMEFIEGSVLVAYNAGFDLGFLESALGPGRKALEGYCIIDALHLARKLFSGIGRYNLGSVAESLGIRITAEHRALSDACMTLKIFRKELKLLKSDGIETVEQIECVRPKSRSSATLVKDYKVTLIEEAIRQQRKLNIVYRSSWNNKLTRRAVTPKKIQSGYDRSYLVAHCHMRGQERVFRLDCIIGIDAEK